MHAGPSPAAVLDDGKQKGAGDLYISNTKIKSRDVSKHVKTLETEFPNLSMDSLLLFDDFHSQTNVNS